MKILEYNKYDLHLLLYQVFKQNGKNNINNNLQINSFNIFYHNGIFRTVYIDHNNNWCLIYSPLGVDLSGEVNIQKLANEIKDFINKQKEEEVQK